MVGGLPLGKFIFSHLLVLVCIAFSISFLAPAARISVRTVLPRISVLDFSVLDFPGLGHLLSSCFCSMRR